jgi:CBS domain-containing protein
MLVRDVMTTPAVTVRPDTTLERAMSMLDQHAITMMPVTQTSGELVGVLSEADVLRDSVHQQSRAERRPADVDGADRPSRPIAELVNRSPVTVPATADLATAAQLMSDAAVKSLPVIDEDDRVVGVISRRDIVHVLARTDDAIRRDLLDLLRRIGTDWTVDVRAGSVTMGGAIRPAERALAELAAMSVLGVRAVNVDPV